MHRKSLWGPLYGLILAIAAVIVAASLLGLRGAAEHHLIDAGLAVAAVLSMAWPFIARRDILLEDIDRAGAYRMQTDEPAPIPWPVEPAREWSDMGEVAGR